MQQKDDDICHRLFLHSFVRFLFCLLYFILFTIICFLFPLYSAYYLLLSYKNISLNIIY